MGRTSFGVERKIISHTEIGKMPCLFWRTKRYSGHDATSKSWEKWRGKGIHGNTLRSQAQACSSSLLEGLPVYSGHDTPPKFMGEEKMAENSWEKRRGQKTYEKTFQTKAKTCSTSTRISPHEGVHKQPPLHASSFNSLRSDTCFLPPLLSS